MRPFKILALVAPLANAFPFMGQPKEPLRNAAILRRQAGNTCPTTSDHTGAVPYNPRYPYLGSDPAKGNNGTGIGGIKIPADGDVDHEFRAPGPNDIRGPCPGLNVAANYGFISRDGVTTYNELVAAQQNLYNVGFDLANLLATAGVRLDGDSTTEKLSIGCDATSRTALLPGPVQRQPGLNGHNKFEADTSLTRNDFFTGGGDNYNFNATLFGYMAAVANGNFSREQMAEYRLQRWDQSQRENGNFYFGAGSLLLYGAASFLYRLFPGSSHRPDLETMMAFFGAARDGNGGFVATGEEKLPDGWYNRRTPQSMTGTGGEIINMYRTKPVRFGANTGDGKFLFMKDGQFSMDQYDVDNVQCALYQLAVGTAPGQATGPGAVPIGVSTWALGKLNPIFANMGCPLYIQ